METTQKTQVGRGRRNSMKPERNEKREEWIRENRYFSAVAKACDDYFARKGMSSPSMKECSRMTYAQRQAYRLENPVFGESDS